jgi:glucosamine--fructose-6-phosphate aminotransferase (isomerizing)
LTVIDKSLLPSWARTEPPFHMYDAILATPKVVEECLQGEVAESARKVGQEIASRGIKRVFCIGCGTSRFAAIATSFALTEIAGLDADYYDAFEFLNYRMNLVSKDTAVFAFSHSGTTIAAYESVEAARKIGAFTVSFTDVVDSRLAKAGEFLVHGGAGKEIPGPKTRSYINTLVMGFQVAAAVKGDTAAIDELKKIPSLLEKTRASLEDKVKGLVEELSKYKRVFLVGGGANMATAFEGSLKIKEVVWYYAEGMEIEEALHGPPGSLDENTLIIAASTQGPSYDKVGYLLKIASKLGCKCLSVTDKPYEIENVITLEVPLDGIREVFSGALLIYPIYLFNYYLALKLGIIPDGIHMGDPKYIEAMKTVPPTHA